MSNFLEYSGGTNGRLAATVSLFTTELNSLVTGNTATSSVNGTSGVFTQSNVGSAIWGWVMFVSGGSFTATGSPNLEGWFLRTEDGTNYETAITANADMPRPPDWIIPLYAAAYASGNRSYANGPILWPFVDSKVFVRQNAGVTLPSSGNSIKFIPVATSAI